MTCYNLKLKLLGSKPAITRKVKVNSDIDFETLHLIIQALFEWEDYHLWEFSSKNHTIGYKEKGVDYYNTDPLEKINTILTINDTKLLYVYDFGDNWEVSVILEKETEEILKKPEFMGGKNAAPLEDSGGIWGFYEKLDIIADKTHPDYEHVIDWVGNDFNSKEFNESDVLKELFKINF